MATHRTLAHSPLVQAIFTMTTDHHRALRTEGVEVLDARVPAAKYDLSVSAVQFRDDGTDGAGAESDRIELEFRTPQTFSNVRRSSGSRRTWQRRSRR